MKKSLLFLLLSLSNISALGDETKPKYGPKGSPKATPISLSNEFFQSARHPAKDFWALTGYYVQQFNGYSCSAASVAMVINAARAGLPKSADDKVITQQELLEKVSTEHWKDLLSPKGHEGEHGVTLERLGKIVEATFKAYGFPKASVRAVHVENNSEAKKALTAALKENEKSTRDFIIANFNQQAFTDDADVGHVAPVGAYDSSKGKILIFDPDREYYEPYWVSVDAFLAGMATFDKTANANRGYIVINTGP